MILAPATIPTIPGLQAALDAKAPTANPAFTGAFQAAAGVLVNPAPNQITQTWNDAADTFTAFQVNITDNASAGGSNLADLQVGGVSKFRVHKSGFIYCAAGGNIADFLFYGGAGGVATCGNTGINYSFSGIKLAGTGGGRIAFADGSLDTAPDLGLARSSAGVLDVNNGTPGAAAYVRALGILDASGAPVVGAQQAAVANATDAASAITQLNALLAAVRAHGLIAT